MTVITQDQGAIITGPAIREFRLKVLRSALELEIKGIKRHGRPVSVIIRDEFGGAGCTSRNKKTLLAQFDEYLKRREEARNGNDG